MKNLKHLFSIVFITMLFLMNACKKDKGFPCENQVDESKTNLKIKNISAYNFEDVNVSPNGTLKTYNTIEAGQSSCYHSFDKAYNYAYVTMKINGEEFIIQPIDYVGEQELGVGKFTYSIDIVNFANKQLSISVSPD